MPKHDFTREPADGGDHNDVSPIPPESTSSTLNSAGQRVLLYFAGTWEGMTSAVIELDEEKDGDYNTHTITVTGICDGRYWISGWSDEARVDIDGVCYRGLLDSMEFDVIEQDGKHKLLVVAIVTYAINFEDIRLGRTDDTGNGEAQS